MTTETLPGRINSGEEYNRLHAQPGGLFRKGKSRTLEGTPSEIETRSHISKALNGRRATSAEQSRRLRAIFSLKPGLLEPAPPAH